MNGPFYSHREVVKNGKYFSGFVPCSGPSERIITHRFGSRFIVIWIRMKPNQLIENFHWKSIINEDLDHLSDVSLQFRPKLPRLFDRKTLHCFDESVSISRPVIAWSYMKGVFSNRNMGLFPGDLLSATLATTCFVSSDMWTVNHEINV